MKRFRDNDTSLGGVFQCARDAAGHGEIVAHFILIVALIRILAVNGDTRIHIISGTIQIARDIAIEIQAVQIVARIESVVATYLTVLGITTFSMLLSINAACPIEVTGVPSMAAGITTLVSLPT